MNWEAIGAIAELLGAIGVIASLVYLARQIRYGQEQMSQNTRALRAGTHQAVFENMNKLGMGFADDGQNFRPVSQGTADFATLDGESKVRFGIWAGGIVVGYEQAFYQYKVGLLDADRWALIRSRFKGVACMPGFADWWKTTPSRPEVAPEFLALVEEILGERNEDADGPQSRP